MSDQGMQRVNAEASDEVDLEDGIKKEATPRRWWQWILVYPGLAVSVLGSIPTFLEGIESIRLGVPFGRSSDAISQNRLWQENFECSQKASFADIKTKHAVEIGSVVCESGDVLLRGRRPEWDTPQYRWVSWDEVVPMSRATEHAWTELLLPSAHASETTDLQFVQGFPSNVLCQRWVGPGLLLQRIGTPQGCFDQVVNTFNGFVVDRRPAPCSPTC